MKLKAKETGQSLIEYLILTCLISVSAIAIVSIVGQNIKARFANISAALRGEKEKKELVVPDAGTYELRGLEEK